MQHRGTDAAVALPPQVHALKGGRIKSAAKDLLECSSAKEATDRSAFLPTFIRLLGPFSSLKIDCCPKKIS